jgi:hypothetical protein
VTIARHFSGGSASQIIRVPAGTLETNSLHHFNRPYGAAITLPIHPALKRRATIRRPYGTLGGTLCRDAKYLFLPSDLYSSMRNTLPSAPPCTLRR